MPILFHSVLNLKREANGLGLANGLARQVDGRFVEQNVIAPFSFRASLTGAAVWR